MIVASKNGNRKVSGRVANATGLADILATRGIDSRSASSSVTPSSIVGLPAANLALRIASTAIAELELGVFRGKDVDRRRVRSTWQSRFFDGMANAYEPWSLLLEQTEASLTGSNNAFWRLDLDAITTRPIAAHFLHVDAVQGRWGIDDRPEYRYRTSSSSWSEWGSSSVVHFRVGYPAPGCVIAPSPIELARDTLASMVAKPPHARNMYEKGAGRQIAVSYPKDVTPEQAERYRKILEPRMSGAAAAGGVRVFGGAPDITAIGLSMSDAQFVESMQLDAEMIAQLYGVPASLLGVGLRTDKGPLTPEHEERRWDRYYLGPRRTRIESAVQAHPAFFGLASRDYPAFVTRPIRGDVKTEALALVSLVQAGILVADDARAELGMVPLPDGVGQIVQITPVGGAPNPSPLELES